MIDLLLILLKIAAWLAIAGSLLELGLELEWREALARLRHQRVVGENKL
jgi:hypothetical protein